MFLNTNCLLALASLVAYIKVGLFNLAPFSYTLPSNFDKTGVGRSQVPLEPPRASFWLFKKPAGDVTATPLFYRINNINMDHNANDQAVRINGCQKRFMYYCKDCTLSKSLVKTSLVSPVASCDWETEQFYRDIILIYHCCKLNTFMKLLITNLLFLLQSIHRVFFYYLITI